jgi:hypothetical protein
MFRPRLQIQQVTFVTLRSRGCPEYYCGGRVVWQFAVLGGHRMSGPPSEAGTFWTVAAKNVPTSPTIRTAVLIVRFMGSSPIPAHHFPKGVLATGAAL